MRLKNFLVFVANAVAFAAVIQALFARDWWTKEQSIIVLIIGLAYLLVTVVSRESLYLYPGAVLVFVSYLVGLNLWLVDAAHPYDYYLPLGLPLFVFFLVFAFVLRRMAGRAFSTPLIVAAQLAGGFLAGVVMNNRGGIDNWAWPTIALGVYAVLNFGQAWLYREEWHLLPGLLFAAVGYYSALAWGGMEHDAERLAYVSLAAIAFALVGSLLHRVFNREPLARPVYVAASGVAVMDGIVVLFALNYGQYGTAALLGGSVVFGVLAFNYRRAEFAFPLTFGLALLTYQFMRVSEDEFLRDMATWVMYGLVAGGILMIPLAWDRFIKWQSVPFLAKDWKRIAGIGVPTVLGLTAAAVMFTISATANPRMCGTCHSMKSQVALWQSGMHNNVGCDKCHYPPGSHPMARGRISGALMLVVNMAGKYGWFHPESSTAGVRYHTIVPQQACIDCHNKANFKYAQTNPDVLKGRVPYKGKRTTQIDHNLMMASTISGIKIQCTTCHRRGTGTTKHFQVDTEEMCYTCHLSKRTDQPADYMGGTAQGSCVPCHDMSKVSANCGYDRAAYAALEGKEDCLSCHANATKGFGKTPPEACWQCHTDPKPDLTDPVNLHEIHVTDLTDFTKKKIDCYDCHTVIAHGTVTR